MKPSTIRPYLHRMGRVPTAIHPFEKQVIRAEFADSIDPDPSQQIQPELASKFPGIIGLILKALNRSRD